MNVEDAIKFAAKEIDKSELNAEADIDARYLVSHVLQKDFTWLRAWQDKELSDQQEFALEAIVQRRKSGEPIAYITGEKDFWTLTLETNASTLIPRPETELLVEKALDYLFEKPKAKVLDLGTGTGAIALAIATERQNDTIVATDYVQEAVELAKRNAQKNNINNVIILQSDWFLNMTESRFDLIVCNPPYVEENDPHLKQGDLRFEPLTALTASDNGLADIKIIIEESKSRLVQGGMLMIEHGYQQASDLKILFQKFGYQKIDVIKDLSGLERISTGIFLQ